MHAATTPPASPPVTAPAEPASRLLTIDAARGLALMGILCVNASLFALPFGAFMILEAPNEWPLYDRVAYFLVHTFAEGKFYPLFSLLFGYGLALQMDRVAAAGGSVGRVGTRRLLFLVLVGFLHATLLWFGDILFVYGVVGLICLIFIRARAKPLLIAGCVLLVVSTLCTGGFGALSAISQAQQQAATARAQAAPPAADAAPAVAASPAPADTFSQTSMGRFFKAMSKGEAAGPDSSVWMESETAVYRDGPYRQALIMRCLTWVIFLIVTAITFGWHILAMFLIGAGLAKLRMLEPGHRIWHKRFALAGLLVAAPMCIVASLLPGYLSSAAAAGSAALLSTFFGPLLSLGYIGAMALLVESRGGGAIGRWFGNTGRMAFTNYLAQTLVMTFIMYHWGLGRYGSFGRAELLAIALSLYAVQTVVSNLWLRRFRFGPLEWIWRMWTYGRAEPMRLPR